MESGTALNPSNRERASFLPATISISLVLFMVGLLGVLFIDARKFSDYVKEHVEITVYLKKGVSDAEVNALQGLISKAIFTRDVRYISREQALDSLKKELGEDAFVMLESNPLPACLDIALRADYASPDSLERIRASLMANTEIVDEVVDQRSQVDRLEKNFNTVAIALTIFCLLLLLIAVTLINNTVRLSMFSSRFLIKSMQLVGATKGFIRKPFIARSTFFGFLAGCVAVFMLFGVMYMVSRKFPELGQFSNPNEIALLFAGVIMIGVLITSTSTFFAVNKYLRTRAEQLY
ncbi:MAG: cell division protein FtsX [Bacteroidota bacterium]